jgi:hypothetical protein
MLLYGISYAVEKVETGGKRGGRTLTPNRLRLRCMKDNFKFQVRSCNQILTDTLNQNFKIHINLERNDSDFRMLLNLHIQTYDNVHIMYS